MCIVQLRCSVTSPVSVASGTSGRSRSGCLMPDHTERAVRTGQRPQLTRLGVGAGHRDADRQAATLVRVPPDAAVLVPRDVGDAFAHADRLEQCLDLVVRAPAAELVAAGRDVGEGKEASVFEERGSRRRFAVEALHPDEPRVAIGGPRPPRAPVALVVRRRGTCPCRRRLRPSRRRRRRRRCARSPRSRGTGASRPGRRRVGTCGSSRAGGRRRRRARPIRACRWAIPSSAARSTSHQSRRWPTVPALCAKLLDAQRLMIVCWSATTSASCSGVKRVAATKSPRPGVITTRPVSTLNVHASVPTSSSKGRGSMNSSPGRN